MLKKLFAGILVLILLLAGAGYYLFSNLDELVKVAIEKYGTQVTGTDVKVSSVKISTTSGEGTISGLVIANPKGFSQPNAFELGAISIVIDTHSLLSDGPIIIHSIDIKSPTITFETDGSNMNLKRIEQNANSYSAPSNSPANPDANPESKAGKPARKIIISDLYIHDGQMRLSHAMLDGKVVTAPMPPIHLTNVGQDSDGASPAQIAKQLISSISAASFKDASQQLAKQISSNMQNALKTGAAGTGAVTNNLKGLLR